MRNKCSYFPSISSTPPRPRHPTSLDPPRTTIIPRAYTHTMCNVYYTLHTNIYTYMYKLYTHSYISSFAFFLLPLRGVMLAYTYVIYAYTYTYYIHYTNSQLPTRPCRSFENTFPSRNVMTQHRRPATSRPAQWTAHAFTRRRRRPENNAAQHHTSRHCTRCELCIYI